MQFKGGDIAIKGRKSKKIILPISYRIEFSDEGRIDGRRKVTKERK